MAGAAKELRLGLVCYGGSSLCIYMHGITKEINRLVSASASRAAANAATTGSERVYVELLEKLAGSGEEAPDLRVIVDAIAGTSAGGINGIFLGKALAGNRSQDSLRDLWFNDGDMNQLVIGPRKVAGIPISWKAKIPLLLKRALKRSPLRGNDMAIWLHQALGKMDADPPNGGADSLLPPGHPLDLWVTITDFYGYQRLISLSRPRFVSDARHRHVLNFHYESDGDDNFNDNAALTFAARTTSCFPAVFPPVNPAQLSKTLDASLDPMLARCFRIYELNGADPNKTYFVDGGVLDNKPFGWSIDTITKSRPAESEVDRRLLYLEPDPGGFATSQGGEDPETLSAALGALTTIPRSEPILDDLLDVQKHNERVGRIRDVIEANFDRVAALIDPVVPADVLAGQAPEQWPWADWSKQINGVVTANAGMSYATYLRLKIAAVLDGFAHAICAICSYPEESNHAALVRAAVDCWGAGKGLFGGSRSDGGAQPTPEQIRFLQAFDLGFMRRRVRFVIAAFNWWYGSVGLDGFPTRQQLDDGKAILYENIATLDALAQLHLSDGAEQSERDAVGQLKEFVHTAFPVDALTAFLEKDGVDGAAYARSHAEELDNLFAAAEAFYAERVSDLGPALLAQLAPITADWTAARRRDLVVRYIGFPMWDVLLYPVQALSQIGEGDAVEVVRVSPHEATLLPVPEGGKVEGKRTHHFYAFFSREARENDYLWGRLDAAEQLVRLLLDSSNKDEPVHAWCKQLFEAILDEEEQALTSIKPKLAQLRTEIAAL
jgi:patatin-related protein